MPQAHFEPTWATIARPGGYPSQPAVGKSEMILNTNSKALYHRFSPYSNYSQNGGFLNWGDQPFYYVYIDQAKDFPNNKAPQTQAFPIQNSIIDVQRVTKFLVSGNGITFLAKQLLLQTGNAFDETRIYNPTSPIVASAMGMTLGSVRPQRFIDTSNILQSLLGPVGGLLGGSSITPPKSTTGKGALPTINAATDGKGLLRGGTANKGLANFTSKWAPTQGGTNSFMSAVAGIASSLFANFIPARQNGIQYRSDEGSYGMMLAGASPRFDYIGNSGTTFGFGQMWVGGSKDSTGIRKGGKYTAKPYRLFVQATNGIVVPYLKPTTGGLSDYISTVGAVGYTLTDTGTKAGYRYEDAVTPKKADNRQYEGSDVMYQYKYYSDQSQLFPTKDPEKNVDDPNKLKASLDRILNKIQVASGGVYSSTTTDGTILRNGSTDYNYDRVFKTKNQGDSPNNYKFGALAAYRKSNVKMVSNELVDDKINKSLKLPTAGQFDTLNTLHVLDKSKKDKETGTTWDAFRDDLVALYFYDVVNGNYIPFRAAIKGVAESANASWEEMPFIGRADKVYSYGGFARNLTFNLHVVISSIAELGPTWQRINYMMTSYKPSNYTKKFTGDNIVYDRFMVPPMFMLTMGDLYRDQPILIQSMVMTVPDDAAWETYNIDNQGYTNWSYMANTIKASKNSVFGQVPREVELGVTAILLEKERSVVGGANFGHAPRTENFGSYNYDTVPDAKALNGWNLNYVTEVPNLG